MRVKELYEDGFGTVETDGAVYHVNLSLTENVKCGDFVIVHAGFAIEKLNREEADTRIALFKEMAEMGK